MKFAVRKHNRQGVLKVRSGFTFLEILIVLAIISVLATLALLNFGPIRRGAQLDLTVDMVDNLINEIGDNARLGIGNIDGQAVCWGVKFQVGDAMIKEKMVTFKAPYFRNRSLDKCDLAKAEQEVRDITGNVQIGIKEITVAEGRAVKEAVLLFQPPRGEVEVRDQLGVGSSLVPSVDKVKVIFGFDEGISDENQTLIFKPLSGDVTIE